MKKHLIIPFAAALMLASCASDELIEGAADGVVTFTAQLPAEISSRAFADGSTATKLQYAVYEVDGQTSICLSEYPTPDVTIANLKATVSLKLIKGKTYNVAFWASAYGSDATNSPYTFDKTNGTITVATTGDANAETRDAFFGVSGEFTVGGVANRTVTLTRPFAQINIGTNDLTDFTKNGEAITKAGIKVTAPTVLNLLTGAATEEKEQTFTAAAFPGAGETFPVTTGTYTYLAMNYVLVGSDKANLDVTFTSDNSKVTDVKYSMIPVQRNYRTNIYGALLTSPQNFDVTIDKNINDSHPAEYEDGFRVAHTQDEVNDLFAQGVDKVVIDGSVLTNPSTTPAAQTMSRAGNGIVEFVLNKAVEHQWLKIKGEAACGISVSYKDGSEAVQNPQFTLLINTIPSVAINLPDAAVEVKGNDENASASTITIESAATAVVDDNISAENIETGDSFDGVATYSVNTVEDFKSALVSKGSVILDVKSSLDLTAESNIPVKNNSTIRLYPDVVIKTLRQSGTDGGQILVEEGATLTLEAVEGSGETGKMTSDSRIVDVYGTLIVNSGVYETSDLAKGSVFQANSTGSIYFNNGTLKSVAVALWIFGYGEMNGGKIDAIGGTKTSSGVNIAESGSFVFNDGTINVNNYGFYTQGKLEMNGGVVKSTSSSQEEPKDEWSYTVRAISPTCEVVINGGEVEGVQGAVGAYAGKIIINDGYFHTHPRVTNSDNFYALFIADEDGECEINGGKFYAEGKSDVYIDSNHGRYSLNGGMFEDKGFTTVKDSEGNKVDGVLIPAEGKKWDALTDQGVFKWQVIAE